MCRGRPRKNFLESSQRTKRRSVKNVVLDKSPEELCCATESSLIRSGRRTAGRVVKLALTTSPRRFKKMKLVHDNISSDVIKYTPDEALAMIVDLGLGKEDYIHIQRGAKSRGANIYPAYNEIAESKKHCYPLNIEITEIGAKIPLQNLLDLTIQRLVEVQQEVLEKHVPQDVNEISVTFKWGFDGSGGHSIYKQNFTNHIQYGDSNIILCTLVTLEMYIYSNGEKKILWKNVTPSSTKHCRPLEFQLKKETNEAIRKIYEKTEVEIAELRPTKVLLSGREVQIKHNLLSTMIDGKTCNALTDTASSLRCNVCKALPKEMNNLVSILKKPCDTSTYKFGFPILHAYIRCFEYLLHVAYKIEIKQWQARGKAVQEKIKIRKKELAAQFYTTMGLVVDQPKQGGGNSNDGNTARKFFEYPSTASQITGLDENLIRRFSNILRILSSCHYINTTKFKKYCIDTAQTCIQLYSWYNMPASVHKILIHGADIIESLPLPIGQLSEDVLEASQKDYKMARTFHSRKTSRENTNADILNWLLISSDPIISSKRKISRKKNSNPFPVEVIDMFEMPDFLETVIEESSDDSNDEF